MSSLAEAVDRAAGSFTGQLLGPADTGYDEWRRVHNGLIDKHPAAIARSLAPMRYVNYLENDAVDPAVVAYGPNLQRLRALKTKWDPDNFFRQNVNILPVMEAI